MIAAEPHDDVPRLVFADWLQENGREARAEFIRVQIDLSRMGEDDPDRAELARREERLFRKNRKRWGKELPYRFRSDRYERGFVVGRMPGSLDGFLRAADETEALIPSWALDWWWPTTPAEGWQDLRAFDRVVRLSLRWSHRDEPALDPFTACEHWRNLASLHVRDARIQPEQLAVLLAAGHTPRLEELDLNNSLLNETTVAALAESDTWGRLRHLGLHGLMARPPLVEELTAAGSPGELLSLDLSNTHIGDEGVERLLTWSHLPKLRSLSLASAGLTDVGATALSLSTDLENLTHLDLSDNMIGMAGAKALAESGSLGGLRRLLAGRNRFSGFHESRRQLTARFGDHVEL